MPLNARGEAAKFDAKPQDKWSATEKDVLFCRLEVWGAPAPKVTWLKGSTDLAGAGARFKTYTDGNYVLLGIDGVKQEDEGAYKCVLDNGNGEVEHEFSVYVTVAGGMDFRAMLMRKKKPVKKVVVVSCMILKSDQKCTNSRLQNVVADEQKMHSVVVNSRRSHSLPWI